VFWYRSIS